MEQRPFYHFLFASHLKRPVAAAEDGNGLSIGAHSVNVHISRADHEILVDHGVVDAQRTALGQRLFVEILNGVGKVAARIDEALAEYNSATARYSALHDKVFAS